jgi:glycine C-acetyltransferase
MANAFLERLDQELDRLHQKSLYKNERVISSAQQPHLVADGRRVINFCANNYLGLCNHPELIQAAQDALKQYGFGLSSVRFICGTQDIHKALESALSRFLGTEDTILFSSCFDANGGVFEALFGEEDAIISDALNHASIIDGIRLCRARRLRYANNDMADLEKQLQSAGEARFRVIVTDGVFSMDGIYAKLDAICALAERYDCLVMVDDSHAAGIVGPNGRGTHEHQDVMGRVDILTGTLGKALGGASGGYVAGRRQIVEFLRQRSRPYLFSNSVAPLIAATTLKVLELLNDSGDALRDQLHSNSSLFRAGLEKLGFKLVPGSHPIIPIMLGDASLARQMAEALFDEGVYAVSFSYPVVPEGQARIRAQMSAAHTSDDIEQAISAFAKVGRLLRVIH